MVKIKYYTPINKGKVVGRFQATLDNGLCIQCHLISGKNGLFVDLPKRVVKTDEETKYYRQVFFEDEEKDREFRNSMLRILKEQEGIDNAEYSKPKLEQEAIWQL